MIIEIIDTALCDIRVSSFTWRGMKRYGYHKRRHSLVLPHAEYAMVPQGRIHGDTMNP